MSELPQTFPSLSSMKGIAELSIASWAMTAAFADREQQVQASKMDTHIDSALIKNIARARKWVKDLIGGNAKSLTEAATREGINLGDVSRLLSLAFLAPAVVEAIVAGKQPPHLCNQKIVRGGALPCTSHGKSNNSCWASAE